MGVLVRSLSDEQLIAIKHGNASTLDKHIAAVQVLHERQQAAQTDAIELARRQHREAQDQDKILHRKTQSVAWIAVAISAIGIVLTTLQWCSNSDSKVESQLRSPATTAFPAPLFSSPPQKQWSHRWQICRPRCQNHERRNR